MGHMVHRHRYCVLSCGTAAGPNSTGMVTVRPRGIPWIRVGTTQGHVRITDGTKVMECTRCGSTALNQITRDAYVNDNDPIYTLAHADDLISVGNTMAFPKLMKNIGENCLVEH